MAWNLAAAEIPDEAKAFLAELGSCGDEREAARRGGVTEADVRRWRREDEFSRHYAKAVEHFESWRTWKPAEMLPPERWPLAGRLAEDPFRVADSVHDLLDARPA